MAFRAGDNRARVRSLARRRRLRSATRRRARRGGRAEWRATRSACTRTYGRTVWKVWTVWRSRWGDRKRARRASSRRKPRGSGFALDPPTRPGSEWEMCDTEGPPGREKLQSKPRREVTTTCFHFATACARAWTTHALTRLMAHDPRFRVERVVTLALVAAACAFALYHDRALPAPLGLDAPASVFSEARAAAFASSLDAPGSRARTPSTPRSRSSSGRSAGRRGDARRVFGAGGGGRAAHAPFRDVPTSRPRRARRRASRRWRTIVWTRSPRGFGFRFRLIIAMMTATSLDTRCCSPRISTRCTSRPAGAITPPTSPSSSRRSARSPLDSAVRTLRRIASIASIRHQCHACRSRTIHLRHRHTTGTT